MQPIVLGVSQDYGARVSLRTGSQTIALTGRVFVVFLWPFYGLIAVGGATTPMVMGVPIRQNLR